MTSWTDPNERLGRQLLFHGFHIVDEDRQTPVGLDFL